MKKRTIFKFCFISISFLLMSMGIARAQIDVRGKVTDASTGGGIPGVNIPVEGTTSGTISDLDGNSTMGVSDANSKLIFSSVGYKTNNSDIIKKNEFNQI